MDGKRSENRAENTSCQPKSQHRPAQGRAEVGTLRGVHRHRLHRLCAMPIRTSSARRCCTGAGPVEVEKDGRLSARRANLLSIRLRRTPPRAWIMRTPEALGRDNRSGRSKVAWRFGRGGIEDSSFPPGGAMTTSNLRTFEFGVPSQRPPLSRFTNRAGKKRIDVAQRQSAGGAPTSGCPRPEPCPLGAANINKTETSLGQPWSDTSSGAWLIADGPIPL